MKGPNYKPDVRLVGEDGNAFAIIGRVTAALKDAGADGEYIEDYQNRATQGNYDELLVTSLEEITHV